MIGTFRELNFRDYDSVILDASYFLAPKLDSDLLKDLRESQIYVSATFKAEADAYRKLHAANGGNSSANSFEDFPYVGIKPQSAWEMARDMSASGHIAVITGNRLFIERLILEKTPPICADIYDLFRGEWIQCGEFDSLRKGLELRQDEPSQTPPAQETYGIGATLYLPDGKAVFLCEPHISGTESELFGVHDGHGRKIGIAKLFKTGSLTPEKCAHLRKLRDFSMEHHMTRCFFPEEILYRDKENRIFSGFLMDYSTDSRTLDKLGLYQGTPASVEELSMKLSDTLRLCHRLVSQVCYLNNYGFFISDFSLKNFAIRADNFDCLLMFDTDSFGYGNYFPGFRASGLTTAKEYNTGTKSGALAFCEDALYVTVFSLLSLGSPPIFEDKRSHTRLFRFDGNIQDSYRKRFFPESLWKMFEDVFHFRQDFSAETLLLALSESLEQLREHPEKDFSYGQKIDKVLRPPKMSSAIWLLKSGALDRAILALDGLFIVILGFLLYQNGFF